jgi:hypothetical protein
LLSASVLKSLGFCLFLAGWTLIAGHASQPFWVGQHIVYADPQTKEALLSTDFPGGTDFAFHQKSKTGDVPKLLPLNLDTVQGAVVVLIKNWSWKYDTRWAPGVMQLNDVRLTYASGERVSTRRTKSGSPTSTFLRIPWGGSYEERVYDLAPNQSYYLLLPQNAGKLGESYSVEIRQRKNENHFLFLIAGCVSLISSLLLLYSQRKSGLAVLDPIKLARTYQSQGRITEAKDVLVRALETHPNRSVEIRRFLSNMASLV